MTTSQQRLAAFKPSSEYLEPVIVPPRKAPHKQSFIILHGRGDNAKNFAPMFLLTDISGYGMLQDVFPHARFVFPTASNRRAAGMKRVLVSQWFDLVDIKRQEERQETQIEGLRETSEWLHILMLREIEKVGASNVVLGGLSQGCAASLIANTLWEREPVAAIFGMCGWLPLRKLMAEGAGIDLILEQRDTIGEEKLKSAIGKNKHQEKLQAMDSSELDVTFEHSPNINMAASKSDTANTSASLGALETLRDYLDLQTVGTGTGVLPFEKTSLFIGHGWLDQKVPLQLGCRAANFFETIGTDVTYREYKDLSHWYSPTM